MFFSGPNNYSNTESRSCLELALQWQKLDEKTTILVKIAFSTWPALKELDLIIVRQENWRRTHHVTILENTDH